MKIRTRDVCREYIACVAGARKEEGEPSMREGSEEEGKLPFLSLARGARARFPFYLHFSSASHAGQLIHDD